MPYMRTNATIYHVCKSNIVVEGSLEVKLPTIWTDEKAEVGRVREETRREEKRREEKRTEGKRREEKRRERVRRKKMQVREKVEKSRNTVFSNDLWLWVRSTSRLAKAAGAEPSREMRDEKLHTFVARRRFRSQKVKITSSGTLLGVAMLKKCTPLWHEAHFQVKSVKA